MDFELSYFELNQDMLAWLRLSFATDDELDRIASLADCASPLSHDAATATERQAAARNIGWRWWYCKSDVAAMEPLHGRLPCHFTAAPFRDDGCKATTGRHLPSLAEWMPQAIMMKLKHCGLAHCGRGKR